MAAPRPPEEALGQGARHRRAGGLPAGGHRVLRRLRPHRHPEAERPGQRAGVDHLLRRRQDRDGPDQRGQPRVGASWRRSPSRCRRPTSPPRTGTSTRTPASARPASRAPCWVGLKGGATQGGSTITQQYVKNYFLTQDQTLSRKGREIIISIKIAKQQSKDQILENYLNTIYYGRGAYGIQTASKAYFNKDVSKLTPSEGAFLASVIRGPSFYDPALGAEQKANAEARWTYVMDGMVTEGWLTPEQRAAAKFPSPAEAAQDHRRVRPDRLPRRPGQEGAQEQAQDDRRRHRQGWLQGRHDDRPERPGRGRQGRARPDAHRQGHRLPARRPDQHQARRRRDRRPLRRRRTTSKEQFNTATDAKMQAGSTFKVFALLAALSQDEPISTKTMFNGASPQYFKEFEDSARRRRTPDGAGSPTSAARTSAGSTCARRPANSVNTVYAAAQHRGRAEEHQGRRGRRRAAGARVSAPTTPTCSAPTA